MTTKYYRILTSGFESMSPDPVVEDNEYGNWVKREDYDNLMKELILYKMQHFMFENELDLQG